MGSCYSGMSGIRCPHGRSDGSFFDHYTLSGWLRLGAFGVISRGHPLKQNGTRAVRMMNVMDLNESALRDLNRIEKIHKLLKHDNIVKFCDAFSETTCRYHVFERLDGKDLFESICARNECGEALARTYMRHILRAIKYCHSKNVILRDLRPESFVIPYYTSSVKLLDIGSAIKTPIGRKRYHGEVGDILYQAPEITRENPYGKPVDVWSCGVILYNMLSGTHPFIATEAEEICTQMQQENFCFPQSDMTGISNDAVEFLKVMLESDQNKRITASDALKHAFFRNLAVDYYDTKAETARKLRVFCLQRLRRNGELKSKAANLFRIPNVHVYSPLPESRRTNLVTSSKTVLIDGCEDQSLERQFLEVSPGHVLDSAGTTPVSSACPYRQSQLPSFSSHVSDIVVISDDTITPL